MNYIALYRKYRPLFFKDVIGQDEILISLKNSLKNNNFSHAYVFSGLRGTGKTSVAKIFARSINCINLSQSQEVCKICKVCVENFNNNNLDIIEIDGASNNGVSEIRDLNNKIEVLPTFSKYKIYIIDEVHMLSTSAFNALLKTLEEPPKHIVFILATTEIHKIPLTILSRCQRFNFSLLQNELIIKNLINILNKEKIVYENKALEEIANLASGSVRDSLSILEQVLAYDPKNVATNNILQALKLLNSEDKNNFINYFINLNSKEILKIKNKIIKNNVNINYFLVDVIKIIKNKLEKIIFDDFDIKKNETKKLFDLFDVFLNYNNYILNLKDPTLYFELFVLDLLKKIKNYKDLNNVKNNDIIPENIKNIQKLDNKNNKDSVNKLIESKQELILKSQFDDPKFIANIDPYFFLAIYKQNNKESRKVILSKIKKTTNENFLYFFNSYQFPRVNKNGLIVVFEKQSEANYLNYSLSNKETKEKIFNELNLNINNFCMISVSNEQYNKLLTNISFINLNKKPLKLNDYYENLYNTKPITKEDELHKIFGEDVIIKSVN